MRVSSAQLFLQATSALSEKYATLTKIHEQMTTGRRLTAPSDDPAATARIMEIDEFLTTTTQYQKNSDFATSRLGHEEAALTSVTDALQRVRELVVQGNNTVLGDRERGYLADEIDQHLRLILQQANSQDASMEYIFAGFKTQSPPFSQDGTGAVSYVGDQGRRMLQVSAARQIQSGDSGHDVFMAVRNGNGTFAVSANGANAGTGVISPGSVQNPAAWVADSYTISFTSATTYDVVDSASGTVTSGTFIAGAQVSFLGVSTSINGAPQAGDTFTLQASAQQSIFATLNTISATLRSSLATPAQRTTFQNVLTQSVADLDQAMEHIEGFKATVGARQHAIDGQHRANEDFTIELTKVKSNLNDLDIVTATADLARETTALQAAQQAFIRLQNMSLFDLLQ